MPVFIVANSVVDVVLFVRNTLSPLVLSREIAEFKTIYRYSVLSQKAPYNTK